MGRQLPASVTNAIRVQGVLVLMSGLFALLTVLLRDDLVDTWETSQPPGSQPPAFAPVAVVLFFTFALLIAVLVVFFREGHPSARLSLLGLTAFHLFTMVVLLRVEPPLPFVAVAVTSGLLDLLLLYLLWHRDTSAYLRGAEFAAGRD